MENINIQRGDRIIITNIPFNYQFKDLYFQKEAGIYEGVINNSIFHYNDEIITQPNVCFYTLYKPFMQPSGKYIDVSGAGNSIKREKLIFLKREQAEFLRIGQEPLFKEVNIFMCEFNDIN